MGMEKLQKLQIRYFEKLMYIITLETTVYLKQQAILLLFFSKVLDLKRLSLWLLLLHVYLYYTVAGIFSVTGSQTHSASPDTRENKFYRQLSLSTTIYHQDNLTQFTTTSSKTTHLALFQLPFTPLLQPSHPFNNLYSSWVLMPFNCTPPYVVQLVEYATLMIISELYRLSSVIVTCRPFAGSFLFPPLHVRNPWGVFQRKVYIPRTLRLYYLSPNCHPLCRYVANSSERISRSHYSTYVYAAGLQKCIIYL